MNRSFADIIYAGIIGDAAGYTFNGMKKNHIKAVFREINGYTDPAPALKDNMLKWRKPGLYSSITVNMLIAAACIDKKNFKIAEYIDSIRNSPEVPGSETGIFRDAGESEKNFIFRIKSGEGTAHHFNSPCARLLPAVIPLLQVRDEKEQLISAVSLISLYTKNSATIACSLLLLRIIKDLAMGREDRILKSALESSETIRREITGIQGRIFDSGHNPDYIAAEIDSLILLLRELNASQPAEHEKIICAHASVKSTDKITRGSVNLPYTILPMAAALSDSCNDPEQIYYTAAVEGGASSALASISAVITTASRGLHVPPVLSDNLVNKKWINTLIERISGGKNISSVINELYSNEPGLTAKEIEEHRSRNRNTPPPKDRKKKGRKENESELTRHVVESWTKVDKARWKKERKKDNS